MPKFAPPRENLYRAAYAHPNPSGDQPTRALSLSDAQAAEGDGRTLTVQWSVADVWTEIDSWYEGHFMERVAPGAVKKTIKENAPNMRILLEHGHDPQLGNKPIAPIDLVEENAIGGYGEGRLFDGLDPLVVDGLRAGVYGASFRFSVMREEIVEDPGASDHNPKGLPERTIKEMRVMEFGPVTWGAYTEASAGVRSITDEIHFATLRDIPEARLRALVGFWEPKRVDSEDIGTLGQMLALATAYIEDQDEGDGAEAPLIVAMQSIQTSLIDLLAIEAAESEPDEPEDEEASSAPSGVARAGTPERREQDTHEAPAVEATPKVKTDFLSGGYVPPGFLR